MRDVSTCRLKYIVASVPIASLSAFRSRRQAPVLHVALELAAELSCLPPVAALPSRSSRHSLTTSLRAGEWIDETYPDPDPALHCH